MERYVDVPNGDAVAKVFGSMNSNIDALERQLKVSVEQANGGIRIAGEDEENVSAAAMVVEKLMDLEQGGNAVNQQLVSYLTERVKEGEVHTVTGYSPDTVCVTAKGRPIKCKPPVKIAARLCADMILFCNGSCGTGKTFLAVAMAVDAFDVTMSVV